MAVSTWDLEQKYISENAGAKKFLGGSSLTDYVRSIFEAFKSGRLPYETTWQECWNNFLGQYNVDTAWRSETEGANGRSRIFIKLTQVKCHSAHAKLIDVLFPGADGVPFDVAGVDSNLYAMLGIPPEIVLEAVQQWRVRLRDHFKRIKLQETMIPAILEMIILGTGVLKGPIVETRKKIIPRLRNINGIPVTQFDSTLDPYELAELEEIVPVIDSIPLWEYYVDPNAKSPADSIGEIHFQRLLPAKFRQLAYQGGYDARAVFDAALITSSWANEEHVEKRLGDNYTGTYGVKDEKVSVLEYQGLVPVPMLKEYDAQLPPNVTEDDCIESVVVLAADGQCIKACVNPLGRRQFFTCPYKERPNSVYGQGVAEAMRDSQKMINSAARLYIDNKALSGPGMVGVNLERLNLKRTRDLKVYPYKTWYVKGNFAPKDAIDAVQFPDITNGLREMIELFERFADEETGLPKYTQGEQSSWMNKTATGMSMLMGQANLSIKTVIKNIDDRWIEPITEATQQFLQWFEEEPLLKVPIKCKATGTDSLMAKELKVEAYLKFMQVTGANPQDAIFTDRPKLIKNIARLLETDDILRSDDEIKAIMEEMAKQGQTPPNLRELVALDKLYPYLTKMERMQVLAEIGIQPDPNAPDMLPPALPPPPPGREPVGSSGPKNKPAAKKKTGGKK